MASSRLDLVVFGATGFTGKVTVLQLLKLVKEKNFTWGVAGRNAEKLKEMLAKISEKTGEELKSVPVMIADVKDEKTLGEMAARARVVVNCVGPYRLYGEPVVKACLEHGAHHVDVSGEPQYMEQIQLEYHKAAEEKGVYIISACGFDSIPAEMGLIHFIEQFKGEVNSVETFLEVSSTENIEGPSIHYGTWESAVYGVSNTHELAPLRRKLYPERLPKFLPVLPRRPVIFKSTLLDQWCVQFPGSDHAVMYRSQRFAYEQEKIRPIQIKCYVGFESLLKVLIAFIMGAIFLCMTRFEFTRNMLLRNPKIFSFGLISHEGPSEEKMKNTTFSITFEGEGWTERTKEGEEHIKPPNKSMVTKVSGRDPGYGFTGTSLLLCAITILNESDKMPGRGGVLPPGAAFVKTSLLKELNTHGLKLEVIKEEVKDN